MELHCIELALPGTTLYTLCRLPPPSTAGIYIPPLLLPAEWAPVANLSSAPLRLMAFAALKARYGASGLDAACGALSTSPDADLFVAAACRKEGPSPAPHALLFYATFACRDACPAGLCGMKVLAQAREAAAPTVSQIYQNNGVSPSITVGAASGRRRRLHAAGGATYVKAVCPGECPACSCSNDKAYAGGCSPDAALAGQWGH